MSPGAMSVQDHLESKKYVMPRAYVGMTFLWYKDGRKSNAPYVGLVTEVGQRTISGQFFPAGSQYARYVEGVRHCDDPDTKDIERHNAGTWDYTEGDKSIAQLLS